MKMDETPRYPIVVPIKNGWAARGPGWAVHGSTLKEALHRYAVAEATHHEIDQRPFWCDVMDDQQDVRDGE